MNRHSPAAPPNRIASLLALALALVVAAAGCLPGAGGPTVTPGSPSATPIGSPTHSPSPSFVRPTPTPRPTFATYIVESGDSLTSIARRFATTVRSIGLWNAANYPSLDPTSAQYDPNRIEAGWILRLIPGTTFDEDDLPNSTPAP